MKKLLFFLCLTLICLVFSGSTYAANRFNVINFRPQTDESPLWGIRQSQNLKQWQFNFGTVFDFAYKPLKAQLGLLQKFNIVKNLYTEHFYGAVGFTDWLEMSVSIPMVWHTRQIDPDTLGAPTGHTDIGDLQVEIKGRILDNKKYPVGLSVAPLITVPSGNEKYFLGEDGITAGGRLILDAMIAERWLFAFNFGGIARKKFNMYSVYLDDQMILGGGAAVNAGKGVSVAAEIEMSTPFEKPFKQKDATPVEFRGGVKWNIKESGLIVGAAGGGGINFGGGSPKFRALALLTYVTPVEEKPKAAPIDYEGIKAQVTKTFYFAPSSYSLTPVGVQELTSVADILNQNRWINLISITGYTDTYGNKSYNMALSKKRAETVYKFLRDYGVDPSRMQVINHGPVAGDPKTSRRAEISVADSTQNQ